MSEVHAYASLRGESLVLIGLRGKLTVDGIAVSEVALEPDLEIELCPGIHLRVREVTVPDQVLGVRVEGGPVQALRGEAARIQGDGTLSWTWSRELPVVLWNDGARWLCAGEDGTQQPLAAWPPLQAVFRYDTAHLAHLGGEPVALSGLTARLLTELMEMGGTASWDVVAGELRPDEPERSVRRNRWDKTLASLRRKLHGRVRPDLLQSAGGNIQLVVLPHDSILLEG